MVINIIFIATMAGHMDTDGVAVIIPYKHRSCGQIDQVDRFTSCRNCGGQIFCSDENVDFTDKRSHNGWAGLAGLAGLTALAAMARSGWPGLPGWPDRLGYGSVGLAVLAKEVWSERIGQKHCRKSLTRNFWPIHAKLDWLDRIGQD